MKIDHIRQLAAQLYADRMRQDDAFSARDLPRRSHDQHARAAIVEAMAFAKQWGQLLDEMIEEGE